MAHPEQRDFFEIVKARFPKNFRNIRVIDCGSLDVCGSAKDLFDGCEYLGVDIAPGPNVDRVGLIHQLTFSEEFDTVISGEMLEHDEHWQASMRKMYDMLKPGGLLALTAAGPTRPEHGTHRTGEKWGTSPDYYRNIWPQDFLKVFDLDREFSAWAVSGRGTEDTYFWGRKAVAGEERAAPPMASGLSVVILSKNPKNLAACAAAVRRHEPGARIVVVDDGLPPIEAKGNLVVVKGEKPFIFARNANLGIRAAEGDDVILLNDDALLETPGGFGVLQRASREHPEFGLIGATTNIVGNQRQRPLNVGLREEPEMLCFVCVLIPRKTFERIGDLDERFTGYGFEDNDYSRRVIESGMKLGIHDGCYVDHGFLHPTFRSRSDWQLGLRYAEKIYQEKWADAAVAG